MMTIKRGLHSLKSTKDFWFYGGVLSILALATIAIIVPYIAAQHAFLGGDINDGFYNRAIDITQTFRRSPIWAIQKVFQEANSTYNSFYTLPLIPALLLLGNTYTAYTISVAIVYLLPLNLVIGILATQLIPAVAAKPVFISAIILAVFTTLGWVTVVIGHPDIGAVLIVALSILVTLHSVKQEWGWLLPYRWQIPLLGFLLGIAILFRRHFAYADVAILGAIVGHTAIVFGQEWRQNPTLAWRNLLSFSIRFGLVLATSLITLVGIAPKFTHEALTMNYVALYASWSRTTGEAISFYGSLYGWGTWILVLVGWIAGFMTRMLSLPIATFLSCYGGISIAIWCLKLRYTETYYGIHFFPFMVLGLTAFVGVVQLKLNRGKLWLTAFLGLYMSLNLLFGLTPMGTFQQSFRSLFAANYPPPVRHNYAEIIDLVEFLRQVAPNQERIFVPHTGTLSKDLLEAAERSRHGQEQQILNLYSGSQIDSLGYYSISEVLKADYVVIAQPFLSWHEGQQDTAKVVFDMFTQGWEITADFEPLSQSIDLKGGVTATIYQRIHMTPIDRAVRTLHAMQVYINEPLTQQLDWVTLSQPFDAIVRSTKEQAYTLKVPLPVTNHVSQPAFLYLGSLTDQTKVKGRIKLLSQNCQNTTLQFSLLNSQGQVIDTPISLEVSDRMPIQFSLAASQANYLLLEILNSAFDPVAGDRCSLSIRNLAVTP